MLNFRPKLRHLRWIPTSLWVAGQSQNQQNNDNGDSDEHWADHEQDQPMTPKAKEGKHGDTSLGQTLGVPKSMAGVVGRF
jgi:hypothetical protein